MSLPKIIETRGKPFGANGTHRLFFLVLLWLGAPYPLATRAEELIEWEFMRDQRVRWAAAGALLALGAAVALAVKLEPQAWLFAFLALFAAILGAIVGLWLPMVPAINGRKLREMELRGKAAKAIVSVVEYGADFSIRLREETLNLSTYAQFRGKWDKDEINKGIVARQLTAARWLVANGYIGRLSWPGLTVGEA